MGIVYAATDTILSNTVAVKVLRAQEEQAENAVARFEREAKATAKLGHPNIVRVMDMGRTDDGGAFLVMELLTGETLDETLAREGPLSVDRAVRIHLQLLDALAAAHSEGVLHRDVKPSNVFVTHLADGTELVKLLDFGLAYLMEEAASKRLTATGIAMGTPAYMSPERITGTALDRRSDIYSVGVSLYRALTGELPFYADTPIALRGRILLVEAPMLSDTRPDLTGTIADVVAQSLAKDPDDRYPTAGDMAKALRTAVSLIEPSLARSKPTVEDRPDESFRDEATRANTRDGAADLKSGPKPNAELPENDEEEAEEDVDENGEPRTWKASTIRGHGISVPPDGLEEPSEAPEPSDTPSVRPPTLPLGGVSVPPQARLSAPTLVAPKPVEKQKPWLAGVAIGVGAGVLLLLGLYLWHMSQTPPPEPTEPVEPITETPVQVEPPTPEPEPEPPPGVAPPPAPVLPQLPTTSLEDAPPLEAPAPSHHPHHHAQPTPTVEPVEAPPAAEAPPTAVDDPLEPDWATPMQ